MADTDEVYDFCEFCANPASHPDLTEIDDCDINGHDWKKEGF
jgi:hypothetical protein